MREISAESDPGPQREQEAWSRRFASPPAWRDWLLPGVLFVATLFTTLWCGGLGTDNTSVVAHLRAGVPFALPLLTILLSHEFGHYVLARIHRVPASPPYFIPLPLPPVGTLGAVIRMRGPMPTRRALIDIGAAGPIAGFAVAIPFLCWGLLHSHIDVTPVPPHGLPPETPLWWISNWLQGRPVSGTPPIGVLQEGDSLLYLAMCRLIVGPIPAGRDVFLHPTAFAAWFGLLVTSLNLLPIGQLDGGHVAFAVLGERARPIGRVVIGVLIGMGLVAWVGWLVWALIGWRVVGTRHPPVLEGGEPLGRGRRAIAWVSLILFVVTFMPVPLALY